MDRNNIWRHLRGAIGNAVVWGGAWAASAMVVFGVLRVTGVLSQGNVGDALFVAARFGIVGAIASVAFSFTAAAFGGIAAAGSLRLAQHAEALLPTGSQDRLDGLDEVDSLAAGEPAAELVKQRVRSAK